MKSASAIDAIGMVALMSLYFFSMGYTIVTPGMAEFAEAFPDSEYLLINSLPSVFLGASGLIFGVLAGRRLPFRLMAVVGTLLCLVGGCAPAFYGGFGFVLFCRALVGVGLGIIVPMANTLVNMNFEGDRRSFLLGVGSLVMNVGGVVFQMAGGILAESGWRTVFLGYSMYIAAFILALFIRSGPSHVETCDRKSIKLRPLAAPALLMFVFGILQYTIMATTAGYFNLNGFGGSSVSGTVLSLFTVGGAVGGVMFGIMMRSVFRLVFPLIGALYVVGPLMMIYASSPMVATVAMVLMGFGFGLIIPASMEWAGRVCRPSDVPMATAVVTSVLYLGNFTSTFWMRSLESLFGESTYANLWATAIVCFALVVVFIIYSPFGRGNRRSSSDGE